MPKGLYPKQLTMPSILSAKSAMAKRTKVMSTRFGRSGKRSSAKDTSSEDNCQGETNDATQDEKEDEAEESLNEVKVPQDKTLDELRLRREELRELREVMKDLSLSKEEKVRRMGEVKQKYGKGDGATQSTEPTAATSKPVSHAMSNRSRDDIIGMSAPPPPGGVDLSAKEAANKAKREVKDLFGRGEGKDAMSTNKERYEKQLVLDAPAKIIGKTDPNNTEPPSLDSQRRAEIQLIMKDRSLEKEERRRKIGEINEKYRKRVGMDLSAKSYAQKPQKELEATPMKSFSERKAMYETGSEIAAGSEYRQRDAKLLTKKDKNSLKGEIAFLHVRCRAGGAPSLLNRSLLVIQCTHNIGRSSASMSTQLRLHWLKMLFSE